MARGETRRLGGRGTEVFQVAGGVVTQVWQEAKRNMGQKVDGRKGPPLLTGLRLLRVEVKEQV